MNTAPLLALHLVLFSPIGKTGAALWARHMGKTMQEDRQDDAQQQYAGRIRQNDKHTDENEKGNVPGRVMMMILNGVRVPPTLKGLVEGSNTEGARETRAGFASLTLD